ncbi:MAG: hypothetical protein A2365_02975 [Candidatus Nealsonbacteria bacterium RIFOXYB1_FULL_40_15]|uniref:SIMPL domain-containing protein n=2 Tax=Candidatus Nealsoniibacteriota TaxID=1817911 RepID=A0A1G2EV07_9BACT|nr:MAG: hypothetical protein A2365_02975 [Candidatus Nealsonbacteria bacterium RIFOXYB1_FULL_40_15]OGZ29191.1 MAG: hypothetical protein A2427_02830 [Candidatus Nealsonbacteria bacterium RIFOXYC1_FULL_40_7]OGZ29872.1 MAG: hypothetical protein A2562_02010 [Candidatus Nealsonbacteria bacterium RIFOXYD1_FULL_39_11]
MFENRKLTSLFLAVLSVFVIALIISSSIWAYSKTKELRSKSEISSSGVGEIYAKPDTALISFSVITESKDVSDALEKNSEKMNNIIESLKEIGVEEKNLKTSSFNIYPKYDYIDYASKGTRVLAGYEARNELQVKLGDISKIGSAIEMAVSRGANEVSSLSLIIENQEEFEKIAREEAVKKAKEKAEELAGALDVKLGKIIAYSENNYVPYYRDYANMSSESSYAPEIEPGENKIQVTAVITYEIY